MVDLRAARGITRLSVILIALLLSPQPGIPADSTAADVKPPEAELKIYMTGPSSGWRPRTSPLFFQLAALGESPSQKYWLINPAGQNVATITSASAAECKGWEKHYTGLGSDEWCLKVENLNAGSVSTTSIKTDKMMLKLGVGVRHSTRWLPILITAGSILFGLVVTWLTTSVLPQRIDWTIVRAQLWALPGRPPITELKEWVAAQRKEGVFDDKALVPILRALRKYGPTQALKARIRLREAISRVSVPDRIPGLPGIRTAAFQEGQRQDFSIYDFYTGGEKLARHPADQLVITVDRARSLQEELNRAESCGPDPRALEIAKDIFAKATSDAGLDTAARHVNLLWTSIYPRGVRADDAAMMEQRMASDERAISALSRRAASADLLPEVFITVFPTAALTALTVATLGIVAGLAAVSANYFPKDTFGTTGDYLALFLSGFSSTTAAGILSALLLWQPKPKA